MFFENSLCLRCSTPLAFVPSNPALSANPPADPGSRPFTAILDDWLPLSYALNAVNRSMGRDDLYPFALAPTVIDKLAFVHERVLAAARSPVG